MKVSRLDTSQLLDSLPLWGIFLATVVVILVSMELGFLLGRRAHQRSEKEDKPYTGAIVAASLGLLAFMLAFTFGAVTSRIDAKKQIILDEANAIGTAYLRADVLPQTHRDEIRRALHDYLTVRIEAARTAVDAVDVERAIARSEDLLNLLWSRAASVAEANPSPMTALFIQSLNQVIDLHGTRVTVALHYRLPAVYWATLYSLAFLAMAVAGYDAGLVGGRRSISSVALVLAFSVVVLLVVALDRPSTTVTQQALTGLEQTMRRSLPTP